MSCSDPELDKSIIIQHPTSDNLEIKGDIVNIINITDTVSVNSNLNKTKKRLDKFIIESRIGIENGDVKYMLGNIVDADYDSASETLFLLDSQRSGVSVYNKSGTYLYTISREGRGPGEVTNPKDILYNDSKFFILDWTFKLNEYAIQDSKFIYSRDFSTPFPPFGFCINDQYVYIKSLPAGEVDTDSLENIFKFELKNLSEPINSFGKMYESNSFLARTTMSMGGVVCNDGSVTIVHYFNLLNLLYGYNRDGSLRWIVRFEDFSFIKYNQIGNRMSVERDPPYLYNDIYNVTPINKNLFVVQIPVRKSSDPSPNTIHTYIVNFDDGDAVYAGNEIPLILSIDGNTLILKKDKPFPQVEIASF